MTKINFLNLFVFFVFFGCANTYKLEKKSILSFTDSYYNFSSPGVKGGEATFNIYLNLENESNLVKQNIQVDGIYFKNKYAKLKKQSLGKYQAFIKEKSNSDKLEIEDNKKDNTAEDKDEKIPFVLSENEAVISYSDNNKKKYVKIKLTEKKMKDFPM